jgi:hypothetical protein
MYKIGAILIFISLTFFGFSQELKCTVQINSQQIQGSEKAVFQKMQQSLIEFMNQTKWTDEVFGANEKIECSFLLNLTERIGTDVFKGTLQIQAKRPVYNTNYSTTIFSHMDKNINFKFEQFEQLQFSEMAYQSELTALFGFYAYYILGLDYDSFSLEGGSDSFRKALSVVNVAQVSEAKGWKAQENSKENRFWLLENHMNSRFKQLRKTNYEYHRLGLDVMQKDPEGGRKVIADAIVALEKVHLRNPNSYNMNVFFTGKVQELVNIFSASDVQQKGRVVQVLNKIDAGNMQQYNKIMKSK